MVESQKYWAKQVTEEYIKYDSPYTQRHENKTVIQGNGLVKFREDKQIITLEVPKASASFGEEGLWDLGENT